MVAWRYRTPHPPGYHGSPMGPGADLEARAMPANPTPESIDAYIAQFPAHTRRMLEEVRGVVRSSAPEATETISYAIPTFYLNGNLVHFAGYRSHIGFYPGAKTIEAFRKDIEGYASAKGSVQFPLDRPVPGDLIRRMVEFKVAENLRRAAKRSRGAS